MQTKLHPIWRVDRGKYLCSRKSRTRRMCAWDCTWRHLGLGWAPPDSVMRRPSLPSFQECGLSFSGVLLKTDSTLLAWSYLCLCKLSETKMRTRINLRGRGSTVSDPAGAGFILELGKKERGRRKEREGGRTNEGKKEGRAVPCSLWVLSLWSYFSSTLHPHRFGLHGCAQFSGCSMNTERYGTWSPFCPYNVQQPGFSGE